MPFARPSLKEIRDRMLADVKARFGIASTVLRRAVVRDLTDAMAGGMHANHGHIDYMSRQLFVHLMEGEFLDDHASLYGITRKAAAFATGNVVFTGTDTSVIPLGTTLRRADGVEFRTDAEVTIASGTATAAVTAVEAGADGNTDAGVALSIVTPISGVNSTATVDAAGLAGGVDTETDQALRTRILTRKRQPAHGGAEFDYENWALEVAGVTRVFVYPNHMGLGTVGVTFVLDDDPSSIIPDQAKVDEVQAYLDDPTRKPVTAQLEVFAPIAVPLDLDITLVPNTTAVQAAVTAELKDFLRREGDPGATLFLSRIDEAISVAQGEENHEITNITQNITHAAGEIPVLGTLTFSGA